MKIINLQFCFGKMDESRALCCVEADATEWTQSNSILWQPKTIFFFLLTFAMWTSLRLDSSTCQNFNVTCVFALCLHLSRHCGGISGNSGTLVVFYAPQFISVCAAILASFLMLFYVSFHMLYCSGNCRLSAVSSSSTLYISIAVWHIYFTIRFVSLRVCKPEFFFLWTSYTFHRKRHLLFGTQEFRKTICEI